MGHKIEVHADIQLPRVPNYLMFTTGSAKLDIADVTDESLAALAAEWTATLIATAQRRRKMPRNDEGAVDG